MLISEESKAVANKFVQMLEKEGFKKDIMPTKGPVRDERYVEEQIERYNQMLDSGVAQELMKL